MFFYRLMPPWAEPRLEIYITL